ncbi:MAG: tetratricopeptide repeat protein [Candidatus Sulfotelmatobacter sp.]
MFWKRWMVVVTTSAMLAWAPNVHAKDFKITLPKRSHLTAVQRLNQEGVLELHKHRYEKAETLFYKAYLLDPDDPFTLNNLGYIAELQGQVDRAQRFYELSTEQATDAVIYRASSSKVEGRTMKQALAIPDMSLQVNHENVEAVRLLSQGRAPEADILLQKVLKDNPQNIFTLNNMGVAKEMEGESDAALKYYDSAAAVQSDAAAVVTLNRSWRGKPVTEMAAQNAKNLRGRLEAQRTPEERVAELNIRGVSDINRNDLPAAEQAFRNAYSLDPNNVFALNNIGYLSEIEGDRETAQFFYDRVQALGGANTTVGLATRRSAEGMKLGQVAADSETKVGVKVSQERAALRQQHEPILLRRRDNSVVQEPETPATGSSTRQ